MITNLGDFAAGATVYVPFHSFSSDDPSASVTITGLAVTDIEIYKDGSATQRASDNGYTLLDTDGIDFDSITGLHGFSIDLSDNSDSGFYAAGSTYWIAVSSITVDAATINFWAGFFTIAKTGGVAAILTDTEAVLADTEAATAVLTDTEAILADTEAAITERSTILTDTEAVLADTEAAGPVLTDTEAILADSEAVISDTEAILTDTEAILIDTEGFTANASPFLLQSTTIATLASQTSFTLTAGSEDDNAYNNAIAVITDSATSTQKAVGTISAYTGSSKTVTLASDPGIFTMAVGDAIDIIASVSGNTAAVLADTEAVLADTEAATGVIADTEAILADTEAVLTDAESLVSGVNVTQWAGTGSLSAAVNLTSGVNTPIIALGTIAPLADDATVTNLQTAADGSAFNWGGITTDTEAILVDTEQLRTDHVTIISDTEAILADSEAIIADSEAILADTEGAAGSHATILADTEAVLADTEAAITSRATILTDTEAVLADTESATAVLTDTEAIKAITDALGATAAARLALSAGQIIPGTVDTVTNGHTPTTTVFQADDITEATADHYNGRIVVFTSGALAGQATDITDYSAVGGIGQFTVTAMTEAPANNDTFIIV